MNHLTQNQINKLTYYYLKKKMLSDELIKAKMHIVQCQSCYEEFCIGIVAAYELCEKNLLNLNMLIDESKCGNSFIKITTIAGKLQISVNQALENTIAKMWNFMSEPQFAAARGEGDKNNQVFVNQQSEYSYVSLHENRLTIRLDDEYFCDGKYEAVYVKNGKEEIIPFTHNEMEECLEIIVMVNDSDYELMIRERTE